MIAEKIFVKGSLNFLTEAIVVQILVLFLILFWLRFPVRQTLIEIRIKTLITAALVLGLWLGGIWVYPPKYTLVLFILIFLALIYRLYKNVGKTRTRPWLLLIPSLILIPTSLFLIWHGTVGRLTPNGVIIDLKSPFHKDARACVFSGGNSPLLNFHIFPSDLPQDQAEIYALDVIGVNRLGFRTKSEYSINPRPQLTEQYAIFNTPIYSPCSGTVIEAENHHIDQTIGGSDKINTGGNRAVLHCGSSHVYLSHMRQGSVLVKQGDFVEVGQILGKVGNSGNTVEPHLHIHAETIVEEGRADIHGQPVHMRFGGEFMARGKCF